MTFFYCSEPNCYGAHANPGEKCLSFFTGISSKTKHSQCGAPNCPGHIYANDKCLNDFPFWCRSKHCLGHKNIGEKCFDDPSRIPLDYGSFSFRKTPRYCSEPLCPGHYDEVSKCRYLPGEYIPGTSTHGYRIGNIYYCYKIGCPGHYYPGQTCEHFIDRI